MSRGYPLAIGLCRLPVFPCQGDIYSWLSGVARKRDCASPVFRRPRGASGRRPIRRVSAGQTILATILRIAPR